MDKWMAVGTAMWTDRQTDGLMDEKREELPGSDKSCHLQGFMNIIALIFLIKGNLVRGKFKKNDF